VAAADPRGEAPLTEAYTRFTGRTSTFPDVTAEGKRLAVEQLLPAEVERLLRDLDPVRSDDLTAADFTRRGLREAIVELLVRFEVYRAYADDPISRRRIEHAVHDAAAALPARREELAWLGRVLLRDAGGAAAEAFVTRFEQTTGPATAKGVEDTAFYRYHRLVALNEVGGDPGEFGRPVADWHDYCGQTARDWPATMTTLSTHDTKRTEDVRARLLVLAEIPHEWEQAVTGWRGRAPGVDPNTDYLFWQTLAGAWPIEAARMHGYLEKAAREAKERTSWTEPDAAFEQAMHAFVDAVYADDGLMRDVGAWVEQHLLEAGRSNSLAQKLLQLTMPGVPDVYQGQELVGFALVDPDNRRPVDYDARRRALDALESDDASVDPKLLVTATTLRLRRARPQTFAGPYSRVPARGAAAEHLLAFSRADDVITVVTRLPVSLQRAGGWHDTVLPLPAGRWRDALTDRPVETETVAGLLEQLPVALLVREENHP